MARPQQRHELQFVAEGYQPANGEEAPTGRLRIVSTQYFAVLGVPLLAGRDFTDDDLRSKETVAIVNQSVARRLFPNGDALNRRLTPTNLGTNLGSRPTASHHRHRRRRRRRQRRARAVDDCVLPASRRGSRLFVRAAGDPRALIPSVTRTIRELSADQAVERPATLEDIRAEVLAPERLNAFVFSTLGGIALLIAVVGIGGVLAFSVSARTREFGVRLAIGSTPRDLLAGVLWDGVRTASIGVAAGAAGGFALARVAGGFFANVQMPGALPLVAAGALLIGAVDRGVVDAGRTRVTRGRAERGAIGVSKDRRTSASTQTPGNVPSEGDASEPGIASAPSTGAAHPAFVAACHGHPPGQRGSSLRTGPSRDRRARPSPGARGS